MTDHYGDASQAIREAESELGVDNAKAAASAAIAQAHAALGILGELSKIYKVLDEKS